MAAAAPSFSNRRAMIGKVHVAKKELGLDDDSYIAVIARVTHGKMSSADCSDAELVAVIEEFRKLGWQAKPKNPAPRHADHATARKARALWISLAQLGAIENGSEKALEAFATRQTGVDRMQWTDQALMYKLIEALNAIAMRNG
ncbi:MAG: gp16 family protein, partial [Sphingorhabdus sp.]